MSLDEGRKAGWWVGVCSVEEGGRGEEPGLLNEIENSCRKVVVKMNIFWRRIFEINLNI